jgi:hypothetical protein
MKTETVLSIANRRTFVRLIQQKNSPGCVDVVLVKDVPTVTGNLLAS